jgi:hypothetical protein
MSRAVPRVRFDGSSHILAGQLRNARVWLVLLAVMLSSDCGRSLEQTLETVVITVREAVNRLTHSSPIAEDHLALEPERLQPVVTNGLPILAPHASVLLGLEGLVLVVLLFIAGAQSREYLALVAPRGPPSCA